MPELSQVVAVAVAVVEVTLIGKVERPQKVAGTEGAVVVVVAVLMRLIRQAAQEVQD
jgi:hypothetical protein